MVCRQFGRREDITCINTDFKLRKLRLSCYLQNVGFMSVFMC